MTSMDRSRDGSTPVRGWGRRAGVRRLVARFVAASTLLVSMGALANGNDPGPQPTNTPPPPTHVLSPPRPPEFPGGTVLPADGPGYVEGSSSVSLSGSANYTLPLRVPAGRAGMQPELALRYDSRGGNGLLGVGWSLSGASEIRRCAKTPATEGVRDGIEYHVLDSFCLDGQKLVKIGPTPGGYFDYRTERDTFQRIRSVQNKKLPSFGVNPLGFEVWTKDGRILEYTGLSATVWHASFNGGVTPDVYNPTAFPVWVLTKSSDRSGNFIRYNYSSTDGPLGFEYRLDSIEYTLWDAALPAQRRVDFVYQSRPDPFEYYEAGVKTRVTNRLLGFRMYAPTPDATELVWWYTFGYTSQPKTGRSLLASVDHYDSFGEGLWQKQFVWNGSGAADDYLAHIENVGGAEFPSNYATTDGTGTSGQVLFGSQDVSFLAFDADGDGKDDLLYRTNGNDHFYDPQLYLRLSTDAVSLGKRVDLGHAFGAQTLGILGMSRPVDIDGDGITELYVAMKRMVDKQAWFGYQLMRWNSALSKFDAVGPFEAKVSSGLHAGFNFTEGMALPSVYFADMDGDGLPDMVEPEAHMDNDSNVADWPYTKFGNWQIRMNLGGGNFGPVIDTGLKAYRDNSVEIVDCYGDGRADVVMDGVNIIRLDDLGNVSVMPTDIDMSSDLGGAHVYADVNGDGLRDWVASGDKFHGPRIRWNTGNGFTPPEPLAVGPGMPAAGIAGDYVGDRGVRVADVNGDGREDLVVFSGNAKLYISNGHGFDKVDLGIGSGLWHQSEGWVTSQLGDFNGDGILEIVQIHDSAIRILELAWVADVMTQVRDEATPFPRDLFTYARTWLGRAPAGAAPCAHPQRCLKHGFPVVVSHSTTQGEDAAGKMRLRSWSYEYGDARMDVQGRGFLGFGLVRTWDEELGSLTTTLLDNVTRVGTSYPFAHLPSVITTATPILPGTVDGPPAVIPGTATARVKTRQNGYKVYPTNNGMTSFVAPAAWTEEEWEQAAIVDADHHQLRLLADPSLKILRERHGTSTYDDYGNPEHDESTTVGGVTRVVDHEYDIRVADWLLGLRSSTTASESDATHPASNRHQTWVHDGLGRLWKGATEPTASDPALQSSFELSRNAQGLITKQTVLAPGVAARHQWYYYDGEVMYPQQTGDDLGHYQTILRHPALGVPVLSQDENGVVETRAYDGFGRIRHVSPAGGVPVDISYSAYTNGAGHLAGVTVTAVRGDGGARVSSTDVLGREVAQGLRGFDGAWIRKATTYNRLGGEARQSRPGLGAPALAETVRVYDTLGRPIQIVGPDGATTEITHSMFETRKWDPEGHESYVTRDVDDRVVVSGNVVPGKADVTLKLVYTPRDQPEMVFDGANDVVVVRYDNLGRRVGFDDPDQGGTRYDYNGFGELTGEEDALVHTFYGRDVLGRMISKTDSDGVSTYVWDTGLNGIGKPASSTSPDGTGSAWAYDAFGKVAEVTRTISGVPYTVSTVYDGFGRVNELRYPEVPGHPRFTVWHQYNGYGYLRDLTNISDRRSPKPLWHVVSRNEDLALTWAQFGNGVDSMRDYDPSTGRVTGVTATAGVGYMLSYGYDLDGNLLDRSEKISQWSDHFEHDALHRLTKWIVQHQSFQQNPVVERTTEYGYDPLGNMGSVTVDGTLVESSGFGEGGRPHAVKWRSTPTSLDASFRHDARGRQTEGNGRKIDDFTAFNLPRSLSYDGHNTTFLYDASGARAAKIGPSSTTRYVGNLYEERNGASTEHVFHVHAQEGAIAQVVYSGSSETTLFVQSDALGSSALIMNQAGVEVERRFFDPFGQQVDQKGSPATPVATSITTGFTGHEHDDELGLVNMRGRLYDARQRRFLTPDPTIADPLFSQAYNRYSYVLNNPLSFKDPSGYDPIIVNEVSSGLDGGTVTGPARAQAPQPMSLPQPLPRAFLDWKPGGGAPTSGPTGNAPQPAAADKTNRSVEQSPTPPSDNTGNHRREARLSGDERLTPLAPHSRYTLLGDSYLIKSTESVIPALCPAGFSDCLRVSTHGSPRRLLGPDGESLDSKGAAAWIKRSDSFLVDGKPPELIVLAACNAGVGGPSSLGGKVAAELKVPVLAAVGFTNALDHTVASTCSVGGCEAAGSDGSALTGFADTFAFLTGPSGYWTIIQPSGTVTKVSYP